MKNIIDSIGQRAPEELPEGYTYAVACTRASDEKQKESTSVQLQQIVVAANANKHFIPPDCIACDEDTSASLPLFERPNASRIIEHAKAIGATHIYFSKMDRAFRNMRDAENSVEELQKHGFKIIILDFFGLKEIDVESAMGRMMFQMAVMVAQFERARLRERIQQTNTHMKKDGKLTGNVPYGKMRVPTTTGRKTKNTTKERMEKFGDVAFDLVDDPAEQAIIARLLTGDLSGHSANEMSRRLNAEAVPTKKGGKWFPGTVNDLLKRLRSENVSA
jgi:site-specific DNA recombinase